MTISCFFKLTFHFKADIINNKFKPRGRQQNKKILVTDDDIHIGNLLEDALTRDGYAVIRAYSGTEAQLILSKEKLDLMLPGLSGKALLPQIKDIPVIIVSAKADTADKVGLSIARSLVEKMNGTISAGYSHNVLSISIVFPE